MLSYYKDKKNYSVKRHKDILQKNLNEKDKQFTRYVLKNIFYSLITKFRYEKCIDKLKDCLKNIRYIRHPIERRETADIVATLMLSFLLKSKKSNQRPDDFVKVFRDYFSNNQMSEQQGIRKWEEIKWRAFWFRSIGVMLEEHYEKFKIHYERYPEEYSPGYYFMNCMNLLISRKHEVKRVANDFDEHLVLKLSHREPDVIGKDIIILNESKNSQVTRNKENEEQINAYKLQFELRLNLDKVIKNYGERALKHYERRNPNCRIICMIKHALVEVMQSVDSANAEH